MTKYHQEVRAIVLEDKLKVVAFCLMYMKKIIHDKDDTTMDRKIGQIQEIYIPEEQLGERENIQKSLLQAIEALAVHNKCSSTTIDMFGIDEDVADEFNYWFCWNDEYGYYWSKMNFDNVGYSSRVLPQCCAHSSKPSMEKNSSKY